MNQAPIPKRCDVAVIGGGPAGSSAATLLAQAGIDTVLLERARHPRPAVGESLIPHFWKYTDLTGASPRIEQEGFIAKAGGITVWNGKIHRIAFADFGFDRPALHVERDRFDLVLLRHAQDNGVAVFERVAAKTIAADSRLPEVTYQDRRTDRHVTGKIQCRYVIDASGPSTLMARQSKSKRLAQARHQFLSFWGYFGQSRYVGADGRSHDFGQLNTVPPVTFVMSYPDGWIWHIPLRTVTSVGLVVYRDRVAHHGAEARRRYFLETCENTDYVRDLLAPARFIEGSLYSRPNFSYHVETLCRDNVYCIGDAGGFVDPVFSHGVVNAFYSASLAALAIIESLADEARRQRYAQLCETRIRQFYGFSRALALGDFEGNGVDIHLVERFMRSVPRKELELMLAASHITQRRSNFHNLLASSGLNGLGDALTDWTREIECLHL